MIEALLLLGILLLIGLVAAWRWPRDVERNPDRRFLRRMFARIAAAQREDVAGRIDRG